MIQIMQKTTKPKGLSKLWREIKRSFKKVWREIKRPFRQVRRIRSQQREDVMLKHCNDMVQMLKTHYEGVMQQHYDDLARFVRRSISAAILHKNSFSKFKNIHQGQEIVLVAPGPSVKNYHIVDGAIHVGVNRAVLMENIDFRYLFLGDYNEKQSYIKEVNQYKPQSCTKFYGLVDWSQQSIFPESDVIEANALRFVISDPKDCKGEQCKFSHLIDSGPFLSSGSVAFYAMQFVLWTNPRTIYLVGCDCTEGYFDGYPKKFDATHFVPRWLELKEFAELYYPETKILSINPVGLKGIFDEWEPPRK